MDDHDVCRSAEIEADEPDPAAANALPEGLGGQFGERRTMRQHLFQAIDVRDPRSTSCEDLVRIVRWRAAPGCPRVDRLLLRGPTRALPARTGALGSGVTRHGVPEVVRVGRDA